MFFKSGEFFSNACDNDLVIGQVGVQIGAPYRTMGLIRESNRVVRALKESFERFTVLFRPKMNALLYF